jgi:hypothetical protein
MAIAATRLLPFVKPTAVHGFTGLATHVVRGGSEIRAIFGGLLIFLGFTPLFLGPVAFQMLGIKYRGIAVARAVSLVFYKSTEKST